jgi:hypothetical protein
LERTADRITEGIAIEKLPESGRVALSKTNELL